MSGHLAVLLTALVSGVLASVNFKDEITLGSIIATCTVVVVAGLFTIRSRIANTWRLEAEGQAAAKARIEDALSSARHELEIANARNLDLISELRSAEQRTDLSSAMKAITDLGQALVDRDGQTHAILREIRDRLPA